METMNTTLSLLAADLLDLASDKFGNHICNDYSLSHLSKEARRKLVLEMEAWNGDQEELARMIALPADSVEFESTCDWYLMSYIAAQLRPGD
jgi:hypothetical protein